jgi:hypothetical protein
MMNCSPLTASSLRHGKIHHPRGRRLALGVGDDDGFGAVARRPPPRLGLGDGGQQQGFDLPPRSYVARFVGRDARPVERDDGFRQRQLYQRAVVLLDAPYDLGEDRPL